MVVFLINERWSAHSPSRLLSEPWSYLSPVIASELLLHLRVAAAEGNAPHFVVLSPSITIKPGLFTSVGLLLMILADLVMTGNN